MSILPTVRVVSPDVDGGYIVINASDFIAGVHRIYDEDDGTSFVPFAQVPTSDPEALVPLSNGEAIPVAMTSATLTVKRGPRGKWFVFRGDKLLPGAHDTEDAARQALEAASP